MARVVPEVVSRLECFEGAPIVEAVRLSGGLQNTNFRVRRSDGAEVVVRVPSPDASEHGQDARTVHASARAAAACGVGPEVLCFDAATGVMASRFLEGRVLTPEELPGALPAVVDAIRRLHERCEGMESSRASDVLDGYDLGPVPAPLLPRVLELQSLLRRTLGRFDALVACHNDLDPANIIVAGGVAHLIDWEWSGPGDRLFDLATLCHLSGADEGDVLDEYFGAAHVTALVRARLALWRLWFGVRGALWSAVKAASTRGMAASELPCDYAAYAAEGWEAFGAGAATAAATAAMERVLRELDPE